jgi:hypothetical protein
VALAIPGELGKLRSGVEKLERFQAKWKPVRVNKARQIKNLEPRFDSIETEKAFGRIELQKPFAGLSAGIMHYHSEHQTAWLRREDSNFDMANWKLEFSPDREEPQNLFPLRLLNASKRWNFKNRTKSAESRASERNGPLENNEPALPIRSPERT